MIKCASDKHTMFAKTLNLVVSAKNSVCAYTLKRLKINKRYFNDYLNNKIVGKCVYLIRKMLHLFFTIFVTRFNNCA